MARSQSGSGRAFPPRRAALIRSDFGPAVPRALNLNEADAEELATHPLIGKARVKRLLALRDSGAIETPGDLVHAGIVGVRLLPSLEQQTFGRTPLRPLLTAVALADGGQAYVDEDLVLAFSWVPGTTTSAEILTVLVRFPSGRRATMHLRLSERDAAEGQITLPGVASGESGELYVLATLRDSSGRVSRLSTLIDVLTRNPVRMYVTSSHTTQSGSVGAPKYDFSNARWYCNASVRWVNSEDRSVNLGRRVNVRATDAGVGEVANLSFNLSSDVMVPARSTLYGSWYTWHSGGPVFDEFSAKGDLTFHYTMTGSGHSPSTSQVWRVMRTIGYNIIRVGDFTAAERADYVRAAQDVASDIFRSRDMTVYGTELYRIEGTAEMEADKTRWRFIDNDAEFDAMAAKYSVPNWYMDVFQVEGYHGGFGASYVNAPADKNGTRSGIVIGRDGDTVNLGQTYAHEAGHHLGLEHADEDDGCPDTDPASPTISDNFIFSSSRRDSDVVTGCQINTMRRHGFVRSMTP